VPAYAFSAHAMGSATSVPNVPGITGARPAPKPSATKCAGCAIRNENDGGPIAIAMPLSEVVERARQRRERLTPLVKNRQRSVDGNRADRRQWQAERERNRTDAFAHRRRRGEAQFVVVTARE